MNEIHVHNRKFPKRIVLSTKQSHAQCPSDRAAIRCFTFRFFPLRFRFLVFL
eukprot:UN10212